MNEIISESAVLIFIGVVILFGVVEKKNVLELFVEGCYEGTKVVWGIAPILLALIVSVYMLRSSGIVDKICFYLIPIFKFFKIESELIPLILLRPISASTTTAIATDIMNRVGADSKLGLITSTIMGSTETTIYVVALYSSRVKIKNVKEALVIGLLADFIGIIISIIIYK